MDSQHAGQECTAPSQARVAGGLGLPQQAVPQQPWPSTERRTITITQGLSGYMVTVGCQWVAFETKEKVVSELLRYLNDPAGVEKEYLGKK